MIKTYGMQHIGFTVPNMDQAVDFFETVFGGVTVLETGLIDVDNEFMAAK